MVARISEPGTERSPAAETGGPLTALPGDQPGVSLGRASVLWGGNRLHRSTVLRQRVDLGAFAGLATADLGAEFCDALLDWIDSLACPLPGPHLDNAFREALRGGGEAGSAPPLEAALLEGVLAVELHMRFTMRRFAALEFAGLRPQAEPGVVELVWDTGHPGLSRQAARTACAGFVELLPEALRGAWSPPGEPYADQLAALQARALRRRLTPTSAVLAHAATHRGLRFKTLSDAYLRIGEGAMQHIVYASTARFATRGDGNGIRSESQRMDRLRRGGLPLAADLADAAALTADGEPRRYRLLTVGGNMVAALECCAQPKSADGDGGRTVYRDVTDAVHGDQRALAEAAADVLGLDLLGIELQAGDIALRAAAARPRIAAATVQPDLLSHLLPDAGESRDAGEAMLNLLYPPGTALEVPNAVIAGSQGAFAIGRELDGILRAAGRAAGLCTRLRTTVGGEPVNPGSRGQRGALRFLIDDPRVDSLVTALSPRRIVRYGLAFETASAAAILGPSPRDDADTFRQGIEVLLRATSGPVAVDVDSDCAARVMTVRAATRLILVALRDDSPAVAGQLRAGGMAIVRTNEQSAARIEVRRGDRTLIAMRESSLRLRDGADRNKRTLRCMYAIALALGLGLSAEEIRTAVARAEYLRS